MSEQLIKVNECDVADAHGSQDQVAAYKEKRAKLESQKDPNTGRWTRPWHYEVVSGFFKQSDPATDDSTFDLLGENLGLAMESWAAVIEKLADLNKHAKENECYKLVFCARHGQGQHNWAVDHFGLEEWNRKWSLMEGTTLEDGTYVKWGPDPELTELGRRQAGAVHDAFEAGIKDGLPIPTKFFSSPFTRSAQTMAITWHNIALCTDDEDASKLAVRRHHPVVKEALRETIGGHTCDKRDSKTNFLKRMGKWGFVHEDGFIDEDVYFRMDWRENLSQQSLRADTFFQELFEEYPEDSIIYTASHAGEIRAIITATGHRQFTIPTAGVLPMVLKGTRRREE